MGFRLERQHIIRNYEFLQKKMSRRSLKGLLQHIKAQGFIPGTVIDVGVATGTPELYSVFPKAQHLLLEPLVEFEPDIQRWVKQYEHMDYLIAAATNESGETTFYMNKSLQGSSLLSPAEENSDNVQEERVVPMIRLDEVITERKLPPPYLLKVDTQGSEMLVIEGAANIFDDVEYIVLEVSLYKFRDDTPLFHEVIATMKDYGFVLYDISSLIYRELDNSLGQVDLAFVRENGRFRQTNKWG